jgi:hypothetical protein
MVRLGPVCPRSPKGAARERLAMSMVGTPSPGLRGELTLIDARLDEQRDLTAVERFSPFQQGEKAPLRGGELAERDLVVAAVARPKTPGGLAS